MILLISFRQGITKSLRNIENNLKKLLTILDISDKIKKSLEGDEINGL